MALNYSIFKELNKLKEYFAGVPPLCHPSGLDRDHSSASGFLPLFRCSSCLRHIWKSSGESVESAKVESLKVESAKVFSHHLLVTFGNLQVS